MAFYMEVLGFELKYPNYREQSFANGVMDLVLDDAELQLSIHAGDGDFKTSTLIQLQSPAEVDSLFETFLARGLDVSVRPDSPVHQSPLDQTWGVHVFCVTDSDGHTLAFGAFID